MLRALRKLAKWEAEKYGGTINDIGKPRRKR